MTQAELAEAIGMTRTSVARMERDEQPVMRTTELAIKYLLSVESKKRGARK